MKLFSLACAALAMSVATASAHKKAPRNEHQITALPGIKSEDVAFDQFAGQLQLATKEKLFYWYTESQSEPASDPIVLWLNGGPGCSSINGFFTENGPFVVQEDLSVKVNPYGWNRKANIVWVDSPAGVGFSAPLQDASYYNDDVVASRLHGFLTLFFDKYPELKNRDFYVTGESYAGMYIPYLVDRLVAAPIAGVKLTGFAIGNPLTDNKIDGDAYLDYYASHGLISFAHARKALEQCENNVAQCMFTPVNCTDACRAAVDDAYAAADTPNFNHYYIYGDVCHLKNSQGAALHARQATKNPAVVTHRGEIGPCTEVFTEKYLNLPEVQEAVHVDGAPVTWVDCQPFISRHFTRSLSSLPKYRSILGKGLKALIYSGDADSVVNFIGTQRWITQEAGLNLKEVDPWKAWYGPDKQIAGYVQGFEALTFKTIKGAGHMVPAVKPLQGLHLFECFVYGEEACAGFGYPRDAFEIEAGDDDDDDDDDKDADAKVEDVVRLKATVSGYSSTEPRPSSSWVSSSAFFIGGGGLLALVYGVFRAPRRERRAVNEERIPFAARV